MVHEPIVLISICIFSTSVSGHILTFENEPGHIVTGEPLCPHSVCILGRHTECIEPDLVDFRPECVSPCRRSSFCSVEARCEHRDESVSAKVNALSPYLKLAMLKPTISVSVWAPTPLLHLAKSVNTHCRSLLFYSSHPSAYLLSSLLPLF